MKKLADRLKLLRNKFGISQKELAGIINAEEPVIKALEQNRTLKIKPKYSVLLEKKLKVNRGWLENGEGNMLLNDTINLLDDINKISFALSSITIPFYEDIKAYAVNGYINNEGTSSVVQLDPNIIPCINSSTEAIKVIGDSMSGSIEDNDIIFIDRKDTELINGKIYVLLLDDEVYVKRVFKNLASNKLILKSDNLLYPQFEIEQKSFTIIGRVIANISIKKL